MAIILIWLEYCFPPSGVGSQGALSTLLLNVGAKPTTGSATVTDGAGNDTTTIAPMSLMLIQQVAIPLSRRRKCYFI